ncbi:hypothetical protein V1478_000678 [Vespula squamosa]|uniref:Uncharacterized protein n=1 Tax=Vespula squamosa TaxID=30214 RepID=A0ABD2C665_VESSQ
MDPSTERAITNTEGSKASYRVTDYRTIEIELIVLRAVAVAVPVATVAVAVAVVVAVATATAVAVAVTVRDHPLHDESSRAKLAEGKGCALISAGRRIRERLAAKHSHVFDLELGEYDNNERIRLKDISQDFVSSRCFKAANCSLLKTILPASTGQSQDTFNIVC